MLNVLARLVRGKPRRADNGPPTVSVPTLSWPGTTGLATEIMACPNCGAENPKPIVLTVDWRTIDHPARRTRLLGCPACTCRFFSDQTPPDYAEPALLERGRVPFYLQQGAGLSLITRPLARIDRPPGSSYLDVGCGFGFGLDYAIHARKWDSLGIDPAPLSAVGRGVLAAPIELRYLTEEDARGQKRDVVMASETIEHVTSPGAFLRILRAALKPGGILILTTPDADAIRPETSAATLVPLLSPGLHLVLQSRISLEALLRQAGFRHVTIDPDGFSLVGFASDAPFVIETDQERIRASFRAYLLDRAASVPRDSDLFIAFAGRALQECINDGDIEGASRAWGLLEPACRTRYGLKLDGPEMVPPGARTAGLEAMALLMPLNLAGLLYARAMLRLQRGETRAEIEDQVAAAAAAAACLRRALNEIAIDDMMTEDIGWIAQAEAALCAAARGDVDTPARLDALPPAPGDHGSGDRTAGVDRGGPRRAAIVKRAFVELVAAGRFGPGRKLAAQEWLHHAPFAEIRPDHEPAMTTADRDALFCLGMLDIQPKGDPLRARARFGRVRRDLSRALSISESSHRPLAPPLFWQAATGELTAAMMLKDDATTTQVLRDLMALVNGDPTLIPEPIRAFGDHQFIWLVNSGQYRAAHDLARLRSLQDAAHANPGPDSDAAGLTERQRDELFCLGILDLQPGGSLPRALSRLAAVRRGVAPAAPEPVAPPLFWQALGGEIQAIKGMHGAHAAADHADQVLATAGIARSAVPADFAIPEYD